MNKYYFDSIALATARLEESNRVIIAALDALGALKAMSEAPYDQPIGAWFTVIHKAIAKLEGSGTTSAAKYVENNG